MASEQNSNFCRQVDKMIKILVAKKEYGSWVVGTAMTIANTMRDKHYKNKSIRIDDSVWVSLKQARLQSGLSWNLFIKNMLGFSKTSKIKNNKKVFSVSE